jgi:hypothetical protein
MRPNQPLPAIRRRRSSSASDLRVQVLPADERLTRSTAVRHRSGRDRRIRYVSRISSTRSSASRPRRLRSREARPPARRHGRDGRSQGAKRSGHAAQDTGPPAERQSGTVPGSPEAPGGLVPIREMVGVLPVGGTRFAAWRPGGRRACGRCVGDEPSRDQQSKSSLRSRSSSSRTRRPWRQARSGHRRGSRDSASAIASSARCFEPRRAGEDIRRARDPDRGKPRQEALAISRASREPARAAADPSRIWARSAAGSSAAGSWHE